MVVVPITSARSTVVAAEVFVSVMYYEEPELLPAAHGTHGKRGSSHGRRG